MSTDDKQPKDDGGPAFPSEWLNDSERNEFAPDGTVVPPHFVHHLRGLSLRDYFAAKAMASLMRTLSGVTQFPNSQENQRELAAMAYQCADAMLAARSPTP